MDRLPKDEQLSRSLQRRAARAEQSYRRFIKALSDRVGLTDDVAERVTVEVLSGLGQRISQREMNHLEAQLPLRLQNMLAAYGAPRSEFPEAFTRDDFVERVASSVGMMASEAEPLIRAVFQVMRDYVSEGELQDVEAQLPSDWADLWIRPI